MIQLTYCRVIQEITLLNELKSTELKGTLITHKNYTVKLRECSLKSYHRENVLSPIKA